MGVAEHAPPSQPSVTFRHERAPGLHGHGCIPPKRCLGAHPVKGSHREGVSRWCGGLSFRFERSRSELLLSIAGLCATSLGNYALCTTFHCGRKRQTNPPPSLHISIFDPPSEVLFVYNPFSLFIGISVCACQAVTVHPGWSGLFYLSRDRPGTRDLAPSGPEERERIHNG
jgi:hypothetical protein